MRGVKRGQADDSGLGKPRLRARDLTKEAFLSIGANPGRSLLTAIGTVLGAAAFVATLGLSSTLSQQVSATFDMRRATEVRVTIPEGGGAAANPAKIPVWQQPEAMHRLRRLAGVRAAGRRLIIKNLGVHRSADQLSTPVRTDVIGMDSETFTAIDPHITLGRTFGDFHDRAELPVALLPADVAAELGITRTGTAVFIRGQAFTVIGIFDDVASRPEALSSVLVPFGPAHDLLNGRSGGTSRDIIIKTAAGAAQLIAAQAPFALVPQAPSSVRAIAPPDPDTLRKKIEGDVTQLSLMLSLVALAIGAVSIGNAATAGIAARTHEIGLRRAVGARGKHIFAQLLGETTLLGAIGGTIGALLGVAVTVVVSLLNQWVPVLDLATAVLASAGGAAAGLLAGLLPAFRAMRIQPVAALER